MILHKYKNGLALPVYQSCCLQRSNRFKMKAAIVLLVLLPIVFAAPDKRWLVSLQQIEQEISHLITPDQTEAGCETGCKALISGLGEILCPTACHSLLHALHLDGSSGTDSGAMGSSS